VYVSNAHTAKNAYFIKISMYVWASKSKEKVKEGVEFEHRI
jgi:hypothetical protein